MKELVSAPSNNSFFGNSTLSDMTDAYNSPTTTSEMEQLERKFDYTSAPSFVLSTMAIILNIFVINFYRKTEITVVPLLYSLIAAMDILCAVGTIYQYVTFQIYFERGEAFEVNAMIFLFMIQIGYRCSVFCNLVLAVTRTIMIFNPFYEIKIKTVKLVCVLYVVPGIALFGINTFSYCKEYKFGSKDLSYFEYVFNREFLFGSGLEDLLYDYVSKSETPLYVISIVPDLLAFIIPGIIVIATCVIQVRSIWKASKFSASFNQRHVTMTVLLMSTLFVVCNTPYSVYAAYILFSKQVPGESHSYVIILLATVFPLLNGALNPVILITRSCEMKRRFSKVLQKMKCGVGVGRLGRSGDTRATKRRETREIELGEPRKNGI
ncbi:hypothetical protein ACHWQZ_G004634 [Mnemiopsis leidyi]